MFSLIKKLIGEYTLKRFIKKGLYVDEAGCYWIENCSPLPFTAYHRSPLKPDGRYVYREIEQNNFGVWSEIDSWLWKHSPLEKLTTGETK